MTIDVLLDTQEILGDIQRSEITSINNVIEYMSEFDRNYILDEIYISQVYEELYKRRHEEECRIFSKFLDRNKRNNCSVSIKQTEYDQVGSQLSKLNEEEARDIQAILYKGSHFNKDEYKLAICQGDFLRQIMCEDDFQQVMTLFGDGINDLSEFTRYINKLYKKLVFDSGIEDSMKRLEAGFLTRRHEILYHLYCIQKEIPDIIQQDKGLDNQSVGEQMSISCSPERDRKLVDKILTKKVDYDKKLVCELHTKMEKIGGRMPDRIYFCASVPKDIVLDGQNLEGKIYIYKITKHAKL